MKQARSFPAVTVTKKQENSLKIMTLPMLKVLGMLGGKKKVFLKWN